MRRFVMLMVAALAMTWVLAPDVSAEHRHWVIQFGSRAAERVFGTAVDVSGNSYTVGGTWGRFSGETQGGCEDPFIAKVDVAGRLLWARQFGTSRSETATAVAPDTSGNVYVAGTWAQADISASGCQGEPSDLFVRSYDGAGNQRWSHVFGTSDANEYIGGAVVHADTLFVVGSRSSAAGNATFLRRYSVDGTYRGERTLGGSGSCQIIVAADPSGVYVADSAGVAGTSDVVVRKLSLDGSELLWTRDLTTAADEQAHGLAVSGEVLYVSGYTKGALATTGATTGDVYVARLRASDGDVEWVRQHGPEGAFAWDIAAGTDGSAYVTGSVPVETSRGTSSDAVLWKLDPLGSIVWVNQSSLSTSGHDEGKGVAVHGGDVRMAGETSGALCKGCRVGSTDAFVASFGGD